MSDLLKKYGSLIAKRALPAEFTFYVVDASCRIYYQACLREDTVKISWTSLTTGKFTTTSYTFNSMLDRITKGIYVIHEVTRWNTDD